MVIDMWALIQNNVVHEVTDIDPLERFHPDLTWEPCGTDVKQGWRYDGETFSEPSRDEDDQASAERAWRDAKLTASEWLVTRHRDEQDLGKETTLSASQFSELLIYRQALRDWPQTETFPEVEFRPISPAWIDEQVQ
ncbi:phage tail assembly chaperone [Pseudomonas brassicacearum]|uniref:phage tail assembly chaperone n=1 Tax=Pseudomonas brassicacearum TaxID=930166 RepID=UPI001BDEBC08|nr:phage tail assembly chaperone [Pseudomonas brassicacearum]